MWNWKIFGTALLVTIAKFLTFVGNIAALSLALAILGIILYIIWSGIVWLYYNLSLAGFLWFSGSVIVLLIISVAVKSNYYQIQRESHLTFWEKVWGEKNNNK